MTRLTPAECGCKVLMAKGTWLVPENERPKLVPPPRDWSPHERYVDRMVNALNGLARPEKK